MTVTFYFVDPLGRNWKPRIMKITCILTDRPANGRWLTLMQTHWHEKCTNTYSKEGGVGEPGYSSEQPLKFSDIFEIARLKTKSNRIRNWIEIIQKLNWNCASLYRFRLIMNWENALFETGMKDWLWELSFFVKSLFESLFYDPVPTIRPGGLSSIRCAVYQYKRLSPWGKIMKFCWWW